MLKTEFIRISIVKLLDKATVDKDRKTKANDSFFAQKGH
jgi:hypothetical protein